MSPEQIGEIRMLYRQAADPQKQIRILAELYLCSQAEICRVLGLPVRRSRWMRYSDEVVREARRRVLRGETQRKVARDMGISEGTISIWMHTARL